MPADRLIEDLWEGSPPATAENTLQVNVSQLRKAIGDDRVARVGAGYRLRVEAGELDLHRFERAVAAGRAALERGDSARAAAQLEEAQGLWRGQALVEAERLEEIRLAALEDLIDARLASGRERELVADLEALVREHPFRERLRGQLMLALYRSGRQADALELFRETRRLLVEELGIEPWPSLQRLEREILEHAPQLETTRAATRTLPAPATPLVGRGREVEHAAGLLRDGARLLTFTGPGGIGKTRLALEVARQCAPSFRDGSLFVALAAVEDPKLVAPTILQSLGVTVDEDAAAALPDALRARELLLVLDNFEQVVEAAPLVAQLLEASANLAVLVTSRALLRLSGEHELPVPPLDPGAEAVNLFVERARAVAPELRVEGVNEEAIREICARLEGIPLAIELAAARTRLLPPPALLARLTSRLELLTAGLRDAPERQQTMRAAIDWSYRLLPPDEQLLLARLGVFAGGASLEAITAVCGEVATLDGLASLVDKSLIRQRGETEPRFTMLETLREYALEQLAATGEEEALRGRHLRFFVELVETAEEAIAGPEQRAWVERLAGELPNLRAAIAFALGTRDAPAAVGLAGGLRTFWYVHGPAEEGQRVLETVLADPGDASPLALNKAHTGAALLASDRGDYAAVRRHLERSLELAREAGDPKRIGVAQMNLGNVALYAQDWDEAERLYEAALEIYRSVDSVRDQAIVSENLGVVAFGRGDPRKAVEAFETAIVLARRAESPHEIAAASLGLARILLGQGERERARSLLAEAYEGFRALDAQARIAEALETFAGLAVADGAPADAARLFGAAAALRDSIGAVRQPDQDRWVDSGVAAARAELGDEAFEREHAAGRALSADAVELLCAGD